MKGKRSSTKDLSECEAIIGEEEEKALKMPPMFGITYTNSGFLRVVLFLFGLLSILETCFGIHETFTVTGAARGKKRQVLDFLFLLCVLLVKILTTYHLPVLKREGLKRIVRGLSALENEDDDTGKGGDPRSTKKSKLTGLSRLPIFWLLMAINLTMAVMKFTYNHDMVIDQDKEGMEKYFCVVQLIMSVASWIHLGIICDGVLLLILKLLAVTQDCVAEMVKTMPGGGDNNKDNEQGEKGKEDVEDKQITREPVFKKYRSLRKLFDDTNKTLDDILVILHAINALAFVYAVSYMIGRQRDLPAIVILGVMGWLIKSMLTYYVADKIKDQNGTIRKWLRTWAEETGSRIKANGNFWHITILLDEVRSDPLVVGKGYFHVTMTFCIWVFAMSYFVASSINGFEEERHSKTNWINY